MRGGKWMLPFALLVVPGGRTYAQSTEPTSNAGSETQEAPAPPWPRVVHSDGTILTLSEPQPEKWDGKLLTATSAVTIGRDEPNTSVPLAYGNVHLEARTDVDRAQGLVSLHDIRITSVDFPGNAGHADEFRRAIESTGQLTSVVPLARLQAGLESARAAHEPEREAIRNTPPRVIFTERPAVLVLVDGTPALRPVAGTSMSRVVNSRALILRDNASFYLYTGGRWFQSRGIEGPWAPLPSPKPELDRAKDSVTQAGLVDNGQVDLTGTSTANVDRNASVYVSTRPAELVETNGPPQTAPIAGTHLWYVTNTDRDLFLDEATHRYFVLLSGRWFEAGSLTGDWHFVAADKLPADFSRIPPSSPKGNVLASVAGTPQARQAFIANQVPQTASVPRQNGPTLDVTYDGSPAFAPIEQTPLSYATNTATPVIQVDPSSYYALSDGVWFTARSPTGPWQIATAVPPVIYSIPTSSPLHYVTYVYVDGYTPSRVYVASTPGYLGTAVAPSGVVVYGTGYDYAPWIGSAWYGAPVTYGIGAGLAFGAGIGFGVGFYSAFGPWWGPYYAHPHFAHSYYPRSYYAYPHAVYARPGYVTNAHVYNQWRGRGVVTRAPYAAPRAYGGGPPSVYRGAPASRAAIPGGGVYRAPVMRAAPVAPAYRPVAPAYRAPAAAIHAAPPAARPIAPHAAPHMAPPPMAHPVGPMHAPGGGMHFGHGGFHR